MKDMMNDDGHITPDGDHQHTINTHISGRAQPAYCQNRIRHSHSASADERTRYGTGPASCSAVTGGCSGSLGGQVSTIASKTNIRKLPEQSAGRRSARELQDSSGPKSARRTVSGETKIRPCSSVGRALDR